MHPHVRPCMLLQAPSLSMSAGGASPPLAYVAAGHQEIALWEVATARVMQVQLDVMSAINSVSSSGWLLYERRCPCSHPKWLYQR